MDFFFDVFFPSWLKFAGALTTGYILGLFLLFPFRGLAGQQPAVKFFSRLSLGIIGIVFLKAVIETKGNTVLWPLPFLYGLAVYWNHRLNKGGKDLSLDWLPFISSMFLGGLIILLQGFRMDGFNSTIVYLSDVDFGYYANISVFLDQTGTENYAPWYSVGSLPYKTPLPYHFMDLWLVSALLKGPPLAPLWTYVYVFIPLTMILVFWGSIALYKGVIRTNRLKWIDSLFVLIVIFYHGGIPGIFVSDLFFANSFHAPKFGLFHVGFIAFSLLLINRSFVFAGLVLAVMPFVNVIYGVIGVPVFILAFLFFLFFHPEKELLQATRTSVFLLIGVIFFLLGFYAFHHGMRFGMQSFTLYPTVYFQRLVKSFVNGSIKYLLFNAPAVLFFGLILREKLSCNKSKFEVELIVLISVIFIAIGAFLRAVFNNNYESNQFLQAVASPLTSVVLTILGAYYFHHAERKSLFLTLLLWGAVLFPFTISVFLAQQRDLSVSKPFLTKVEPALAGKNKIGGYISNPQNRTVYSAAPQLCKFCNFLTLLPPGCWANDLDVPADKKNFFFQERRVTCEISPMYRFQQKLKNEKMLFNHETAQMLFVDQENIDFIVLEKGAQLPKSLAAYEYERICDSTSGHCVVLLDRQKD